MLSLIRSALPLAFVVLGLTGCFGIYYPGACHDNFKALYQHQIGTSTKDEKHWFARYRSNYSEYQTLPNGNVEYANSEKIACRIFYEIDPKSETVVGWRYEGSKEDCAICP